MLYYKTSHVDPDFKEADFLQKKFKMLFPIGAYNVNAQQEPRGIPADKKRHIIEKLGPLMEKNRLPFFHSLSVALVGDMIETYD